MGFFNRGKLAFIGLGLVIIASLGCVTVFAFSATGQANLFKDNLIITTEDLEFTYSGEEIIIDTPSVDIKSGALSPGDYITVIPNENTLFSAGTYLNEAQYVIYDINGNDVTGSYNISHDFGEITIKQRVISLSLNTEIVDIKNVRTGDTFDESQLIIGGDGLAVNDSITATVTRNQDGDVFSFSFDYEIYNSYIFYDVTKNYREQVQIDYSQMPNVDLPELEEGEIPDWLDVTGDIPLDGSAFEQFGEMPSGQNLNADVFKMSAKKEGVYYFRGKSYGDYFGTGFGNAEPYSDSSVNPLEYHSRTLTDQEPVQVNIRLSDNVYVNDYDLIPYFLASNDNYGNDISYSYPKNDGKSYSLLCYQDTPQLRLDEILNEVIPPNLENEENEYYNYVKANYTYISEYTKNYLKLFISENNLNTSSLQAFSDDLVTLFSTQYTYKLEGFTDSADTVNAFLFNSKTGNCQNFASSAVLLFRTLGYPARYTTGYMVPYLTANEIQTVKAIQAHAWCELYIEGNGWIPLEFTPASSLGDGFPEFPGEGNPTEDPNASDDPSNSSFDFVEANADYDYLFSVTSTYAGKYYLREESYGDYNGVNGFNAANLYYLNGNNNPNSFLGNQIYNYSGQTYNQVKVTYENGPLIQHPVTPSYFFGWDDATNDIYSEFSDNPYYERIFDIYDYDYFADPYYINNLYFNDETYIEDEELYYNFVLKNYLNIDENLKSTVQSYFNQHYGLISDDVSVILDQVKNEFYNFNIKYKVSDGTSYEFNVDSIQSILNGGGVVGDSSYIASLSNIILRSLNVPTRLVSGYLYISDSSETKAISNINKYYWNEVYFKGHGWVKIDYGSTCGKIDEKYYYGKRKATLYSNSISKEYDGEYIEPEISVMEYYTFPTSHWIVYGSDDKICDAGYFKPSYYFSAFDYMINQDVTYQYAIYNNLGELSIYKKQITVYTKSISCPYKNGAVLESSIDYIEGLNENKYSVVFESTSYLDGIGSKEAMVEIKAIFNEYDQNVIDNFDIYYVYGNLEMY